MHRIEFSEINPGIIKRQVSAVRHAHLETAAEAKPFLFVVEFLTGAEEILLVPVIFRAQ